MIMNVEQSSYGDTHLVSRWHDAQTTTINDLHIAIVISSRLANQEEDQSSHVGVLARSASRNLVDWKAVRITSCHIRGEACGQSASTLQMYARTPTTLRQASLAVPSISINDRDGQRAARMWEYEVSGVSGPETYVQDR